ncbi:hypothetical protein CDG77_14500 [Nostoc sp. 'Peltigera membranacea cyanobiont' 213]|uniref:hypothetical protein n=1 Tax=unclassified Nostoc TaxID=2593658 RepID=UPI000B953170|nr:MULTISPECIES: hypothetical protein [unclassified Nostoc]AVH64438.1 hypothetical protein NPM_2792 [Nostoc sp. 'Peltigera membranacea cyanobiont' N6]OYD92233.1 hypothetical protein CDG77_14500 [Nostoc sp. 'Peltigera membranacea cyanobiont' 213]
MFINELSPLFREFIQHPASFVGGLFSGVLRLNLADDPVKSWLDQQTRSNSYTSSTTDRHNGKTSGPQQISID